MLMFEQMRAQGLNPRVCDTPVPYYENKVLVECLPRWAMGSMAMMVVMRIGRKREKKSVPSAPKIIAPHGPRFFVLCNLL